eukprot:1137520-Pelagomonas_calceolata.AAC.1
MEPSGKRHWRVKEGDQRTWKHILREESKRGVCTLKNNMLFLHIILGITKVTGRGNVVCPSSLLNFESVDVKADLSHTAHDVFGQIQASRMISRELSPVGKMSKPEVHHKQLKSRGLADPRRIPGIEGDISMEQLSKFGEEGCCNG